MLRGGKRDIFWVKEKVACWKNVTPKVVKSRDELGKKRTLYQYVLWDAKAEDLICCYMKPCLINCYWRIKLCIYLDLVEFVSCREC